MTPSYHRERHENEVCRHLTIREGIEESAAPGIRKAGKMCRLDQKERQEGKGAALCRAERRKGSAGRGNFVRKERINACFSRAIGYNIV